MSVESARTLLREMGAAHMSGAWSAPGRVNLIGEHTDYNDGFVLPFATPVRTYVAAALREDDCIRVASTMTTDPVEVALGDLDSVFPDHRNTVPEWARYPLGVAWALGSHDRRRGVDLAFSSDVPVGAGLSSSAAIESAAALALNDLWGLHRDRLDLALAGQRAENEAVGAPTGVMDQVASLFAEPGAGVLLDCRSLERTRVPFGFGDAGLTVLVIDTRVSHSHATGGYAERRAACERAAALLGVTHLRDVSVGQLTDAHALLDDETFRRARHVVTENQRVLDAHDALVSGAYGRLGDVLIASHASLRDDFEVSVPELDLAVDSALAVGAIGARMTGGGFGGSAIALAPNDLVASARETVTDAFARAGFRAPVITAMEPSGGARRES